MLSLCWCQLRHINHASINITTSILGGQRWHGIWRTRWSPTRYWKILRLCRCVIWRYGCLLRNIGQLRWINDLIIQWRRHIYHQWWQLIDIWVSVLATKAPVITRGVLWISGWLLMNRGKLRWINHWIFQRKRHIYHRWRQLISLWVTVLAIKSTVITRSRSLPTLIFPCSTFLMTTNTLWTWHDEFNMSFWWCRMNDILFFDRKKRWELTFWRNNCIHVWVSVPGI